MNFLISTLDTVSDQLHASPVLPPREVSPQSTRWIGGWMGPEVNMGAEDALVWN